MIVISVNVAGGRGGHPTPEDLVTAIRHAVDEAAPGAAIDVYGEGGGPDATHSCGPTRLVGAGGRLAVDTARRAVWVDGRRATLTNREFDLLTYLLDRAGAAIKRSEILRQVWGNAYDGSTRTLDVHVRRLRVKLAPLGQQIVTARGYGYGFD